MSRQMSAERVRRAVVLEADGTKQASITVAEGEKQAAILRAEGEKQAAILRAHGFGEALTRIFESAREIDEKTMTLQYLDTLKALGASPSSKFLFPLEFTRLLDGLMPQAGGNGGARQAQG
jgi:regulator of protease activity HflC (stomatin/prohibitin superfamily)